MKQKFTILVAMICLMAFVMSAQPHPKQSQRACDVMKLEQQKGETQYAPTKQTIRNASEAQQLDNLCYITTQQSPSPLFAESESADTVTVKLMYNLKEEEYGAYRVFTVMAVSPEWSNLWRPDMYTPEGYLVGGIVVKVPIGTYDLYTNTYEDKRGGSTFLHIHELVTIDKDTTIYLDVLDVEHRICWDIYDNNNQLLVPDTWRWIDQYPGYEVIEVGNVEMGAGSLFLNLDGFGTVYRLDYTYGYKLEGEENTAADCYINKLSDRYKYALTESTLDTGGMTYINKLECGGSGPFPLCNKASDYVACEEQIQRTPKGYESVNNPQKYVYTQTYVNNSCEFWGDVQSEKAVVDDGMARLMVNAAKNDGEQLEGINMSFKLGVMDYNQWIYQTYEWADENGNPVVYVDSMQSVAYILTPEMMVNQDRSFECLVRSDVEQTPEIGIWKDDYPPHPKFSYAYEQKKGIIGNNCPLVTLKSLNSWDKWSNANRIMMSVRHMGRNGESIGSGINYSRMKAKYNGEEIWNGKCALDSLSYSWVGNPDGAYELEFTNDNIAVDGITGKNVTTVYFDQRLEDQNPPVLTMLQFRDGEDNVTDHFDTPDDGVIIFAGGDINPKSITYMNEHGQQKIWEYKECQPMEVEVSYAPYGTDEWLPLEGVEHQAEYDDIPGLGFFYSAPLTGVTVPSENGWFDLKFRLVDEAGNWQEQTLSPAFRIEDVTQSAVIEVKVDRAADNAIYNLAGQRMRGDLNSLPHGIYITGGKKIVK